MDWTWVAFGVLALLPLALAFDFHPNRERLDARGAPLPRDWEPQIEHPSDEQSHH